MPPLIPGAFGAGMDSRAAYGGSANPSILRVTNLSDRGNGSFREALEASGPRVVIFEVSGTIQLQSDIAIRNPYITVAGQTAPAPGIQIRGADNAGESAGGIFVFTHDVFIQHLRIRPGDGGPVIPPTHAHNAMCVYGPYDPTYNVVFDHLSLGWAGGKSLQFGQPLEPPGNFMVWRCIVHETLYWARNVEKVTGPSSLGFHLNTDPRGNEVSVLQSVFAHNSDRNPEFGSGGHIVIGNNIWYDWGKDTDNYQWASFFYIGNDDRVSFIGNIYKAGNGPHPVTPLYAVGFWSGDNTQIYLHDNIYDGCEEFDPHGGDPRVNASPVDLTNYSFISSTDVMDQVLANAGAFPASRDSVDERVLADVINKTGTVIKSQNEVGGWPIYAEVSRPLTVPDNPHMYESSGYTTLEEWLHEFAREVEGEGSVIPEPTEKKIIFDYSIADLQMYLVTHFEASWDDGMYERAHVETVVLEDTPPNHYSYQMSPLADTHRVSIRAVSDEIVGPPTDPLEFNNDNNRPPPPAPINLRFK